MPLKAYQLKHESELKATIESKCWDRARKSLGSHANGMTVTSMDWRFTTGTLAGVGVKLFLRM